MTQRFPKLVAVYANGTTQFIGRAPSTRRWKAFDYVERLEDHNGSKMLFMQRLPDDTPQTPEKHQ